MIRIKLILSYDGYYINGWTGTNGIFVDNLLSEAIYKLCGEKVICHCAGRTDKGVHALYQVCHFDLTKEYKRDYIKGINFYLPHFIRILNSTIVNNDFHARFSAQKRYYKYLISNSMLLTNKSYVIPYSIKKLNINMMQEAINIIKELKDFSFFYPAIYFKSNDSKIQRTLENIYMEFQHFLTEEVLCITFVAKSFAHHQVRNIVGTLLEIGINRWTIDTFKNRLKTNNRNFCAATANAHGLYLVNVLY